MIHIPHTETKIYIVLLIFCATNASFAIHPHVLGSPKAHNYDSSEIFMALESDTKEQNMRRTKGNKEAKENILQNVEPERKIKERRKNNSEPLSDFIGLCLIGVGMLGIAALLVLLYGLGETSAGVLLVGVAFAGILFILIFIKLIKLGKKLGKKPKNSASANSRNAAKIKEEKAFVMNSR